MEQSFSHVTNKNEPFDKKLDIIFNKKNGFFIELGAYDGIYQSNTAFFEFYRGWKGILIEPSVNAYELCKEQRQNSTVLNYCCVSDDYSDTIITGDFNGNLMSSVGGERSKSNDLRIVETITLEKILDSYKDTDTVIDFLSLDTEGYELNILKGLNLSKYRPRYILIEIYNDDLQSIHNLLISYNYTLQSNFSNYNKYDNPGWDGTHNDYLYSDSL